VLLAAVADGKIHRLALFDGRRLHVIPRPAPLDAKQEPGVESQSE
jgi:hypothetical protein